MKKVKVIIIGAAGRDFHNFNTVFRDNKNYEIVAFTAAQIPNIDSRIYPASLAGRLYPNGIPIYNESELSRLIKQLGVNLCVFAYSDVSYNHVMQVASIVNAAGANFSLISHQNTQIKASKPVISICAVRTGCGKSQTTRRVIELLHEHGLKVVVIRHPMPYGDLEKIKVQRFATIEDLTIHQCTIEEMEEYEPHIIRGNVVYAGVDYLAIIEAAQNDPLGCDVILWDGGNNDLSFYKPDLSICIVDPHRPNHEISYYPGETVLRTADVVVVNKIDSATLQNVDIVLKNVRNVNPMAQIILAKSTISVDNQSLIKDKTVLVIEDGPTLTHGEMNIGAGTIACQKFNAKQIIDPKPYSVGLIKDTYRKYTHIVNVLPAMGYGEKQIKDLETTINNVPCDSVVIGTPIDLNRLIKINKPSTHVYYDLEEIDVSLKDIINTFVLENLI